MTNVAKASYNQLPNSPEAEAAVLGAILIVSGLGFKIAAVPFHVWAPDVYQGAPTPVTAFLSVGSKTAGFVLLLRVVSTIGGAMGPRLTLVLAVLARHELLGHRQHARAAAALAGLLPPPQQQQLAAVSIVSAATSTAIVRFIASPYITINSG